jgi:hypothetical protein
MKCFSIEVKLFGGGVYMGEFPVYREPLKAYKIVSNQCRGRLYEVAFGEVDWGKMAKRNMQYMSVFTY